MLNQANLIGRTGKAPELRYTPQGKAVASLTIATSESYKTQSGEKKEKTVWHNIVMWNKLAEIANQYVKKGDLIYVSGKIDNRSYDDKDGNKKYISEIIVNQMKMLGGKRDDSGQGNDFHNYGNAPGAPAHGGNNGQAGDMAPPPTDDDLPF